MTNIVPFGGNPFYNITQVIWEHPIDIYVRYNETGNICENTTFLGENKTDSTNFNVVLNTTSKVLIANMSNLDWSSIYTLTNISCSSQQGALFIPYFCFFSHCSECVKSSDWSSNCEWLI